MARTNLTEPQVKKFKHTGKANQSFLRDTLVNGLAVRVTATSKAYVFERRHNKKLFRVLIGDTSSYTLAQAREKAREIGVMIDAGQDPQQKKKDQEAEQEREKLNVEDAWKEFLKYHKSQWADEHYNITEYHARAPEEGKTAGILWPLLEMKMSDITAQTLVKWAETATKDYEKKLKSINTKRQAVLRKATALEEQVKELQEKGDKEKAQELLEEIAKLKSKRFSNIRGNNAALRHGYMRFRAFWNWASQREEYAGFASPDILKHADLKRLLPTSKPKKDVLEKGQLKAWFKAVGAIDNKVISAYLQVLLLTGARRNELATLKWSDVELRWNSMFIRDKVEGSRKIPLTPYVKFLIKALPKTNDYVFSSKRADSGYLQEPRKAHDRALALADLPSDLSLHGLRRSFKSLSEWVEMPVGIVAQIMGHKPSATAEKHYTVRPVDLLAKWHTKLEKWILAQAGIQFNPKAAEEGLQVVK